MVFGPNGHRKRYTRLCGHVLYGRLRPIHVGFGAGTPQWWWSFDFWINLLAGTYLVLQRNGLQVRLLAHRFTILASGEFHNSLA